MSHGYFHPGRVSLRQTSQNNHGQQGQEDVFLFNLFVYVFYTLIIQKIQLAQQKAVISANITLLDLYWEIGNVILKKKKEQGFYHSAPFFGLCHQGSGAGSV